VLLDELFALFSWRDIDPFAAPVEDLRLVLLCVDLNFVVVGGFVGADFRDNFYGLAGGLHAVHASGADADALLSATLAEPVELRAIE